MPKLKLTKTAVDTAIVRDKDYELRDTIVPGFLLKVTPAGRKIFMVQYTTGSGQRRKPAIGRFGEITVEQARSIAQDWLADVRKGGDPSAERSAARKAPTMAELCNQFISDYSETRNKPATIRTNRGYVRTHIVPALGHLKVADVTRADVTALMKRMERSPINANRVLSCLRKMFNLAEVWGYRPDGSNPCRHIPKYPERGKTRLITDPELKKLYAYLEQADAEGLEHPFLTLAIRLQFEFAARMSEIVQLEWSWVDLENCRIVWPDSKTGGMSKPISAEALRILEAAPRMEDSPYVCPSIFDPTKPMGKATYYHGWKRILKRAGLPHIGTHGIRHRAATDIANSGVPLKVGMVLTAHKTVTMFMRYVHTEDDPIRFAAEAVAERRKSVIAGRRPPAQTAAPPPASSPLPPVLQDAEPPPVPETSESAGEKPLGYDDGQYTSRTRVGNYRPFRHRAGANRALPPGTKRSGKSSKLAGEANDA